VYLPPEARARHLAPILLAESVSRDEVRDVSVALARGEMLAIVGPRGSGKTTLLRMLGGLLAPEHGRIVIDAMEISSMPGDERLRAAARSIGFVHAAPHLLREFTALENVMMPMLLAGSPRRAARERAGALLARTGIGDAGATLPAALDDAGRRRVALARALANEPLVLLADEPEAGAEAGGAAVDDELLRALNLDGLSVVFTTSDLDRARLAPRRASMIDGRLVREEEDIATR
jgi:ABC-type lipoprotein export system ATPase subunit